MSLEPIDPDSALDLYLADRENILTQATLYSHRSRLGHFTRWCTEQDIQNLNELTGRQLHEYRLWRRDEGDLAPATEKTRMDTVRVFVKWLESIDGVEQELHAKVLLPTLNGTDNICDVMLEPDQAEQVLGHLRKYEYASRPHVALAQMWHTMMRVGAVNALDCEDYDATDQSLQLVHRPETGTPLKNAEEGERFIVLSEEICDLLDDWLADRRPAITEESGREPLVTTPQGCAHTTTLRGDCYRCTRPCVATGECPHDRGIEECSATEYDEASRCPTSVSPHALRRGGITHALSEEWPMKAVGDRANVSETVLEQYYYQRSEREKMDQRRKYLDNL